MSRPKRIDVTDYAVLMGVIYSMVKQDYLMQVLKPDLPFLSFVFVGVKFIYIPHPLLQERIVSALNLKSSSGELESYSLMWSLRPFINNDIMDHAWKLIP